MDFELVVKSPVAGYDIGARITDPKLVAEILADARESLVVKVAKAPEPEAEPEA